MSARGYPNANLSRRKAELSLTMLLYGCTDDRLRTFTADGLATSYNVPAERAEALLNEARRGRGQ